MRKEERRAAVTDRRQKERERERESQIKSFLVSHPDRRVEELLTTYISKEGLERGKTDNHSNSNSS